MKLLTSVLILAGLLVTTACGPTKNNPLENYKNLNLSEQAQSEPQKIKYELVTETKEVPVIQIKYVPVKVEVPVIHEKAVYTINCPENLLKDSDNNYLKCLEKIKSTADQFFVDGAVYEIKTFSDEKLQKEEAMMFIEGKEGTYYISAKILFQSKETQADVKFTLNIEGAPKNAKIENLQLTQKSNEALYKITWTPQSVIKSGESEDRGSIKITLENIQYNDVDEAKNYIMQTTFDAISKTSEKEMVVLKAEDEVKQEDAQTAANQAAKEVKATLTSKTVLGGDKRL